MYCRGAPSTRLRPGGPPFLAPLLVSLDPPGGPPTETEETAEGGPTIFPRLQQQLLQQQRSLRLWLQKVLQDPPGKP